MKWHKLDANCCKSECGEYSVAMVVYAGTTFYEAWHGPTFLQRAEDPDFRNMQRVCEAHKARAAAPAVELHENGDGC